MDSKEEEELERRPKEQTKANNAHCVAGWMDGCYRRMNPNDRMLHEWMHGAVSRIPSS
jgi:hypothetical protein